MTIAPPDRALLRARLLDLLAGSKTREEIADWAVTWVREPMPAVQDLVAWQALKDMSGADLRISPTDYLHGEDDFHSWLDKLELTDEGRLDEHL